MNRTKSIPSPQSLKRPQAKCPFKFVIAYEDTATRNRVYNLYDHLAQQLFDEFDFDGAWYKFDYLRNLVIRGAAVQEAAQAQMIVLSLRQGNSLPGHVVDWIDGWKVCRGAQKSALVTLVAGDDPTGKVFCPIQSYLQKTAAQAGMDFFAHNFDFPGKMTPMPPKQTRSGPELSSIFGETIPHRTSMTSHWGINE